MADQQVVWAIEDHARDLDLIVFELEQKRDSTAEALAEERKELRRKLEQVRDALQELARGMA